MNKPLLRALLAATYDKERAAFLRKKLEGCDKLPAQRQSLLRKYKSDALIQQVLGKQQP